MSDCNTCKYKTASLSSAPCVSCTMDATTKNFSAWEPLVPETALDVQIAGNHYKGKGIQPVEYIAANKLNFLEGCVVKRITRWRDKQSGDRFDDLNKIKHEIDLLIEMEKKYGG